MLEHVLGKALYEAVDEAFTALGSSSRILLLGYLEREHSITLERIPNRLDAVTESLELLLGQNGKSLSKLIAKHLYRKVGLDFPARDDWDLVQYVEDARSKLERTQGILISNLLKSKQETVSI